jgi:hypothetical protein
MLAHLAPLLHIETALADDDDDVGRSATQRKDDVSYSRFIDEVAALCGPIDRATLEKVVVATVRVLGMRLRTVDAEAVAEQLPPNLAEHVRAEPFHSECCDREFEELVADRSSQLATPVALRVVCRLLAERLNEQARAQLRMQRLSSLFGSYN